jgi:hypothetical protein
MVVPIHPLYKYKVWLSCETEGTRIGDLGKGKFPLPPLLSPDIEIEKFKGAPSSLDSANVGIASISIKLITMFFFMIIKRSLLRICKSNYN